MTILPIPLENCSSARDFFRRGGKVEIPRPRKCFYEQCGLAKPLRKNGTYVRQAIYWGIFFLVQICRFRCSRCGRTASCPYAWQVPFRRFTAEVIAAGIQTYASTKDTYRGLSSELSDIELAEPERDIRTDDLYKKVAEEDASRQPDTDKMRPIRPGHTTVFNWVQFACRHAESLLTHMQKELVQERKRGKRRLMPPPESFVENPNSYKAATAEKKSRLDRLTFLTQSAALFFGCDQHVWCILRAYFLTNAESRKDLLTTAAIRLSITHTFESAIF